MSNIDAAGRAITYELHSYAETITREFRDHYFDPRNRDSWVAGFCEWLAARQRKSAEVRASND